ncbi:MAG TPA: hypothetical protein VHT52_14180 [Stellaceae bacterium]|jgi:hypothetical protein|nr:hypothetical protein [Stellaceae bacterium]
MISQTTTTPPNLQAEFQHRVAWKAGVMGAFNVLATVLAVRLALLIAIGGAITLTWLALQSPDLVRLAILGVYCGAVVIPTTWLACYR